MTKRLDFSIFQEQDIESLPEQHRTVVMHSLDLWRSGAEPQQIAAVALELSLLDKSELKPIHYPMLGALVMCRGDLREAEANIHRYLDLKS